MRRAAADLLDALDPDQRRAVLGPFATAEWHRWTYLPGERPGLLLGRLTPAQRDRAHDLLETAFSPRGRSDLAMVLRTEEIRRELSPADDVAGPAPRPALLAARPRPSPPARSRGRGGSAATTWSPRPPCVGDAVVTRRSSSAPSRPRSARGPHRGFQSLPREQDLARRARARAGGGPAPGGGHPGSGAGRPAEPAGPGRASASPPAGCRGAGWTAARASCWRRSSASTSTAPPPPWPTRPGRPPPTPAGTRSASPGRAGWSGARATTTPSAGRRSCSSTTTPRSRATTCTACGATGGTTWAATCWPGTTPSGTARRPARR